MITRADTLPVDFYNRPTIDVAGELLGTLIVREIDGRVAAARIVETEAYLPDDPASHAFRGPTARNGVMFGPPGRAYVYLIYGMHHCVNAVTEDAGIGGAVLIRAAQPLLGLEGMWRHRFPRSEPPPDLHRGVRSASLANGPAKLCRALDIRADRDNGVPLFEGPLRIVRRLEVAADNEPGDRGRRGFEAPVEYDVVADGRVGISRAADKPWRFSLAGNPFVSRRPDAAIPPRRYRRK
ncbi:MAG: DNA-3-methyladenine glycosylase [Spirochaetaceae bacterium]